MLRHTLILSLINLIPTTFAITNTGVDLCFYKKSNSSPCEMEEPYSCCRDVEVNGCCKEPNDDPDYCGTMGGDNLNWEYTVNMFKNKDCDRGQFGMCYTSALYDGTCCSKTWDEYPQELTEELQECSMRLEGRTDEVFEDWTKSKPKSKGEKATPRVSRRRSNSKQPERPPGGDGKPSGDTEKKSQNKCRHPNIVGYVDGHGVHREIQFEPETQWKHVKELLDNKDYRGLTKYPASGRVRSGNRNGEVTI